MAFIASYFIRQKKMETVAHFAEISLKYFGGYAENTLEVIILKRFFGGTLIGFLNGFFGSGGGVLAVPVLEKDGCSEREAHACSVALIFALCLVTAAVYGISGNLDFSAAWKYIPWGAGGALCGALFLRKINARWLKRLFGAVIVAAAVRGLFS